jgi:hypothetical protein
MVMTLGKLIFALFLAVLGWVSADLGIYAITAGCIAALIAFNIAEETCIVPKFLRKQ